MTSQLKYFEKLNKQQKIKYKKFLLKNKKSICMGVLCRGEIKSLKHFD